MDQRVLVNLECEGQWQCPISDDVIKMLTMASGHTFCPKVQGEGHNDGYIHTDTLRTLFGFEAHDITQCHCAAHTFLHHATSETECEDMKALIRSSPTLSSDGGCEYACALLRLLFTHMELPTFRAMKSGQDFGVSYTLLCEKKKYPFRGYPDFVIHKDDIGAGRILVATGEIQSTRRSDVQNSIYAIGSLLNTYGNRPLLCSTIYKDKNAQIAVAKLIQSECDEAVAGAVSLKYVISPSPMDLKSEKGLKDLSTCLFYMLKS